MQVTGVEVGKGCQPVEVGDGNNPFHEPDPVGVLEGVQHPIDVNQRDRRDVRDHRLPDSCRERLAFTAPGRTEPCHDLAEEVGDLPFSVPPGVDEPSLGNAEFDERQPAETSLDAPVGLDQGV